MFSASAAADDIAPARQRVAEAHSFYCYYGTGEAERLSQFDVVIVESRHMEPEVVSALTDSGVVVVGYLSVGEDNELRAGDGTGPGGFASWYFDADGDGQPDRNATWKSYFADARDPAWVDDRLAEAKRIIEQRGCDGVFIDTIDTHQRYPETSDAMVALIARLRAELPGAVILLNHGFMLFDRLAPLSDGLVMESFTLTYDHESGRYVERDAAGLEATRNNVQQWVMPVLEDHPQPVMSIEYAEPAPDTVSEAIQRAYDRAATFGFLVAVCPIHLDRVYRVEVTGVPDEKYLRSPAMPEESTAPSGEGAAGGLE